MPKSESYVLPAQLAQLIDWRQLRFPQHLDREQKHRLAHSNCIVLTGTQDSGKTTAQRKLTELGFPSIPEGLRDISEEVLAQAVPMPIIKRAFPHIVALAATRHVEAVVAHTNSDSSKPIFADRGLGDYIAALSIINMAARLPFFIRRQLAKYVNEPDYLGDVFTKAEIGPLRSFLKQQISVFKEWGKVIRYHKVMWLEPMPVAHPDEVRSESKLTKAIFPLLVKMTWRGLGYKTQTVPALWNKLDQRVQKILDGH